MSITKIIGTSLAVVVFVIFIPVIVLFIVVMSVIAIVKAVAGAVAIKHRLPRLETRNRVKLDRVRHFRLTQYSFERAEKQFEQTTQQFADWMNKQEPYTAESLAIKLWFFLVDEDHDLTPDKVGRILSEYLAGSWRYFRVWRLRRAYGQYVGALKDFRREFGGVPTIS